MEFALARPRYHRITSDAPFGHVCHKCGCSGCPWTETQHPAETKRHQRNSSDTTPTIALEAVDAFIEVSFLLLVSYLPLARPLACPLQLGVCTDRAGVTTRSHVYKRIAAV